MRASGLPVLASILTSVLASIHDRNKECDSGWRAWAGRCWTITMDHVTADDSLYTCRKLRQDSHVARADDDDMPEALWDVSHFLRNGPGPPVWTASLYGTCMVLNHKQLTETRLCSERHPVLCSTSSIPDKPANTRSERSIGHEELRENITNLLESLESTSRQPVKVLQRNLTETGLYVQDRIDDLSVYMSSTEMTVVDCEDLIMAVNLLSHLVVIASNGSDAKYGHNRVSLRVLPSSSARGHTWSAYHATAASYSTATVTSMLPSRAPGTHAVVLYSAALVPAWSYATSPCPAINESTTLVSDIVGALLVDAKLTRMEVTTAPLLDVTLSHRAARILQLPTCAYMIHRNGTRSWHTEGCRLTVASETVAKCRCPDGDAIAVFMVDQAAIGMLCWISCAITAVACLSTSLAIIGYRLMRSERSYVRMSFLTSLGSAEVAFLAGLRWMHVPAVCTMFAVWIHYSVLASFAWLLAYILFLGNDMREAADKEQRLNLHMYTLVGWLVPACVVTITLVWRHADYRGTFYCWVNTDNKIHYTLIGPAALFAFLAIIILFHVVKRYMFNSMEKQRKYVMGLTWTGIRSCTVILPSMTVTWFLATFLVKYRTLALQVTFSLANTLLIHRARSAKKFAPQRVIRKIVQRLTRGGENGSQSALWPWRRKRAAEWVEEVEVCEARELAGDEDEEFDDCDPMKKAAPETVALTQHEGKPARSPSPMRLFSSQELDYIDESSLDEFLESRSKLSEISVHVPGDSSLAPGDSSLVSRQSSFGGESSHLTEASGHSVTVTAHVEAATVADNLI